MSYNSGMSPRPGAGSPGRGVSTRDGYEAFVRDAAELVATHDPAPPAGLSPQLTIFDVLDDLEPA